MVGCKLFLMSFCFFINFLPFLVSNLYSLLQRPYFAICYIPYLSEYKVILIKQQTRFTADFRRLIDGSWMYDNSQFQLLAMSQPTYHASSLMQSRPASLQPHSPTFPRQCSFYTALHRVCKTPGLVPQNKGLNCKARGFSNFIFLYAGFCFSAYSFSTSNPQRTGAELQLSPALFPCNSLVFSPYLYPIRVNCNYN